jgi:hypothetical protein
MQQLVTAHFNDYKLTSDDVARIEFIPDTELLQSRYKWNWICDVDNSNAGRFGNQVGSLLRQTDAFSFAVALARHWLLFVTIRKSTMSANAALSLAARRVAPRVHQKRSREFQL